jgi:hypothetical protein
MRTLSLVIAVALVVACSKAPVGGWDRVRFGMRASEIQTAYPAATTHKRETYDDGRYCDLTLAGTSIAGYDFTVHFLMDNSDRLDEVALIKEFEKDPSKTAYDTVKDLLIQKYGKPTTDKFEMTRILTFSAVWHVSTARISLSYFPKILTGPAPFIKLTYDKPGDTDKL